MTPELIVLTLAACGRRGAPEAPPAAAERQVIESEQQEENLCSQAQTLRACGHRVIFF